MVTFHHIPWKWSGQHLKIVNQSWLFVDFFFVLSGFVIASAYVSRICTRQDAAAFGVRRFFRLYPLHAVTTLGMLALVGARYAITPDATIVQQGIDAEWWRLIVANVFLVQSWGFESRAILNIPSWSISVEAAAYIVFAIVCLSVTTPGRRVGILAVISLLSLMALVIVRWDVGLGGDVGFRIPRCLFSFGLGTVVWNFSKAKAGAAALIGSTAVQVALLSVAIASVAMTRAEDLTTLLAPPIFAAAIYALAVGHGTVLSRTLAMPPLLWLGTVSYSIYLTHALVFTAIDFAAKRVMTITTVIGDSLTVAGIVVTLIVSWATFRWIETPWRLRGHRSRQTQ